MRLIKYMALGSVLSGYATIVLGGYVSSIGAGLACPDWPTCHGKLIPPLAEPGVAVEYFHRLAAFLTGIFTLGILILAWAFYRGNVRLVSVTTAGFALLGVQVLLGMITITSLLNPLVVTAHLAVATAFLAVMTVATLVAFRSTRNVDVMDTAPKAQEA